MVERPLLRSEHPAVLGGLSFGAQRSGSVPEQKFRIKLRHVVDLQHWVGAMHHPINQLYQGSEMLTHQALEMLKRRTGLTKAR
jgi:hypothetical protein